MSMAVGSRCASVLEARAPTASRIRTARLVVELEERMHSGRLAIGITLLLRLGQPFPFDRSQDPGGRSTAQQAAIELLDPVLLGGIPELEMATLAGAIQDLTCIAQFLHVLPLHNLEDLEIDVSK